VAAGRCLPDRFKANESDSFALKLPEPEEDNMNNPNPNQTTRHAELAAKAEAALPIIEKMIADDEFHNPFVTMAHVLGWKQRQIIWISEEMERHGWLWNGNAWQRSRERRRHSLAYRHRPGTRPPAILQPQKYPASILYAGAVTQLDLI
jgi:hypothetical protein